MEGSVGDLPILMIQDPADVQGGMVYDCRPPLLPVSLEISNIGPLSVRTTVVAASVAVPPWEEGPTISGVGSDVVAFPGLGVAPLVDSGTDLEDELSTPDGSPSMDAIMPGSVVLPEICSAPWGGIALNLAMALLEVSVLPPMVTPILDPVVESLGTPALYPEPPLPVLSVDEQVPVLESVYEQVPVLVSSPLREVAGSPVLDDSPSCRVLPTGSGYELITFPISPSLRTADVSRPPSGLATMGQYLLRDSTVDGGVDGLTSSADASDSNRGPCCCSLTEYAGLVSGPRKLMLMFSPSALLAGPPRYPLVNGDKFPPPSTECCRPTHQYRSPGAQHVYQHNVLALPGFVWLQLGHD